MHAVEDVVIVAARRTPQGRFLGALAGLSPVDLACAAAEAALEPVGVAAVDQVILGNVLSAGHGMNVARQVGVRLGIDVRVPAFTVNMMCGSGLQAIRLAAQAIRAGEATAVLCGGTESMSNAAYLLPRVRRGLKLGDAAVVDSLLADGLVDAFDRRHMGLQVEDLAADYRIDRAAQDAWAAESQRRHAAAAAAKAFAAEIVPVAGLAADEHPRPETTVADLAGLNAAFRADGSVTAGNSSGINDGAAVVVLAARAAAERASWPVLCRWIDSVAVGCPPQRMGLGPVHALQTLAERRGCAVADLGEFEINEAFAAQVLACLADLGLDHGRVNPHGGAIAVGHPIGASGGRLVVHAAQRIAGGGCRRAAAALCVGGGMGVACLLER